MSELRLFTYSDLYKQVQYSDRRNNDYYKINNVNYIDIIKNFKVEYTRLESKEFAYSNDKWDYSNCTAKFYFNDKLIFEKELSGNCLVLYGDGETFENTFYTNNNKNSIEIYDMNNKLIRETTIGHSTAKFLKKINNKYMLSNTSCPMTHDNTLGLINMEEFFNPEPEFHTNYKRPYDNSRIGLPTESYDEYVPIIATNEGFVLYNPIKKEIVKDVLKYEDVDDFDFYIGEYENKQESLIQTILSSSVALNIDENKLREKMSNISVVNKNGSSFINISDVQKSSQ